jgi:hypothetical protein
LFKNHSSVYNFVRFKNNFKKYLTSIVSIRFVSLCTWISCRIMFWEKKTTTNIEDWITVNSFKFWDINFRGLENNKCPWIRVRVMLFNATFNNISVRSWRSVLLVEETGVPGENQRPPASNWQILSHNVVSRTPRRSGIRTHNVSGDVYWVHW